MRRLFACLMLLLLLLPGVLLSPARATEYAAKGKPPMAGCIHVGFRDATNRIRQVDVRWGPDMTEGGWISVPRNSVAQRSGLQDQGQFPEAWEGIQTPVEELPIGKIYAAAAKVESTMPFLTERSPCSRVDSTVFFSLAYHGGSMSWSISGERRPEARQACENLYALIEPFLSQAQRAELSAVPEQPALRDAAAAGQERTVTFHYRPRTRAPHAVVIEAWTRNKTSGTRACAISRWPGLGEPATSPGDSLQAGMAALPAEPLRVALKQLRKVEIFHGRDSPAGSGGNVPFDSCCTVDVVAGKESMQISLHRWALQGQPHREIAQLLHSFQGVLNAEQTEAIAPLLQALQPEVSYASAAGLAQIKSVYVALWDDSQKLHMVQIELGAGPTKSCTLRVPVSRWQRPFYETGTWYRPFQDPGLIQLTELPAGKIYAAALEAQSTMPFLTEEEPASQLPNTVFFALSGDSGLVGWRLCGKNRPAAQAACEKLFALVEPHLSQAQRDCLEDERKRGDSRIGPMGPLRENKVTFECHSEALHADRVWIEAFQGLAGNRTRATFAKSPDNPRAVNPVASRETSDATPENYPSEPVRAALRQVRQLDVFKNEPFTGSIAAPNPAYGTVQVQAGEESMTIRIFRQEARGAKELPGEIAPLFDEFGKILSSEQLAFLESLKKQRR